MFFHVRARPAAPQGRTESRVGQQVRGKVDVPGSETMALHRVTGLSMVRLIFLPAVRIALAFETIVVIVRHVYAELKELRGLAILQRPLFNRF